MRNYIKITLFSSLLLTACDDFDFGNKFLEKPLSDEMNLDSVFSKKMYAEQHLAQAYHSLPDFLPHNNRLSWGCLESITDLADYVKGGGTHYHKGSLTSNVADGGAYNLSYNTVHGEFSAVYGIRQAYIFLENVDCVPDMTEAEKKRRKGEAKMIIAYHYMQMFRNLGGMPWIDHAYKPTEEIKMTRMTIEESVEKICALIDEAAADLEEYWLIPDKDAGRMSKGAALALKSRLLTFAASPLYNDDQPYLNGEAAQLHYVWWGDKDMSRWQDALDAGLDFLRENKAQERPYQLVKTGNPRKDFCSASFDRANGEVLISSHRFTKWNINDKAFYQLHYGVCNPSLNCADMFQMKGTGEEFSWDNPVHRAHPFFDANGQEVRDPRLYETVIVTGDKFWGRTAEIYQGGKEAQKEIGGQPNWRWDNLGYTGIAQRKLVQDHNNELSGKFYQCPLMRLPEIYLNIAEAMNELGNANVKDEFGRDAYDYVDLVRERVEMPPLNRTMIQPGVELREAILKERALEFAFEEVRFYDINRWKHKDYLDVPLRRMYTYPTKEGALTQAETKSHEFRYEIIEGMVNRRVWVEMWSNRYYLSPIPWEEINKQYGLVQNPGWE